MRCQRTMKQVLDGKLYDTEDAELIAKHNPVTDRRDFRYLNERLYRTSNGSYFLHCEGGPMTEYAKSTGDGKTGGEEIRPVTREEALAWCEDRHVDGEIVVEEFGELVDPA